MKPKRPKVTLILSQAQADLLLDALLAWETNDHQIASVRYAKRLQSLLTLVTCGLRAAQKMNGDEQ